MLKINYNNSLVSLTNSILAHYGKDTFHPTLPVLDEILSNKYKNIVLLVLDGLGINILAKHLNESSFLRAHIKSEISSVFPPTTTAATTSILTGKTPLEHGWLGWSLYFKEIDKCVDIFRNIESGTENIASEENPAFKYLPVEDILTALKSKVRTCGISPFHEYTANNMEVVGEKIKLLCDEDGNKFIYAYNNEPDSTMHRQGIDAKDVNNIVNNYNNIIENLSKTLSNTLLIITADHGMTDTTTICLEDYPKINNCLIRRKSIEPRCLSLFVKEINKKEFASYFKSEFNDKFILLTHDEFLSSGLLGSGTPHDKIKDFVGDFVAVAISDISLTNKNSKGEIKAFIGDHAGYSAEELTVPLIIVKK